MAKLRADEMRVIAHFDIDCFYAQSEELRCPSLQGRPVGVTQKFLVVTCNYVARDLGVPKMVSIDEAKRKLPSLVLVNGEDLTPYRAESKKISAVLKRFGTVERHGLDEGAVDITARVRARLQSGPPGLSFSGHVLGLGSVTGTKSEQQSSTLMNFQNTDLNYGSLSALDVSLLVGSQVAFEIRAIIEKETGFHCSCGIAQNKMLAKLASSLNKPSMQTCLLQGAVAAFLDPLSTRKIPGVGKQMQGMLSDVGVETVAHLKKVGMAQLCERFGDRVGLFLFNACRGQDLTPVQDKGPPKSISVEDSFRKCQTMQHAVQILRVLAPDLIRRLDEDQEETRRRPKSFTLKWRVQGSNWSFTSVSTQMPVELLSTSVAVEKRAFTAVDVATKLLSRSLGKDFNLAVLNMGATNFVNESENQSPANDIRNFLQGHGKNVGKELKVVSKRDARLNRESFKPMARNVLAEAATSTSLASPSAKLGMKYCLSPGRGTFHDWDSLENDDKSSNNDSGEELDEKMDPFKLSVRQSSFNQLDSIIHKNKGDKVPTIGIIAGVGYLETQATQLARKAKPSDEESGLMLSYENSHPLRRDGAGSADHKPDHLNDHRAEALALSRELFQGVLDSQDLTALGRLSGRHVQSTAIKAESKPSRSEDKPTVGSGKGSQHASMLTADSDGTFGMADLKRIICDKCGRSVDKSDIGQQEHADYHFALTLDKQEKGRQLQSPESESPESSSGVSPMRNKPERPLLKKPKLKNRTLDGFFVHLR